MGKSVAFVGLDSNGQDEPLGSITLDGRKLTCGPSDSVLLNNILKKTIVGPGGKVFNPTADPEGWLANLRFQYKSAYLRAFPTEESE